MKTIYELICCNERNIEKPKVFETFEDAAKAMCADVAAYMVMQPEQVEEARLKGEHIDDCSYVGYDYAFSDKHTSCDWRIVRLEV